MALSPTATVEDLAAAKARMLSTDARWREEIARVAAQRGRARS
jgi:hypothetical protein